MRAALWLLLLAGCGVGSSDPGLDAWLRVAEAQFVPGLPTPSTGPRVQSFAPSRVAVSPGDSALHLAGALEPGATGVALWLDGDRGHWLLPAALPDVAAPQSPTFAVTAAIALEAPIGARDLHVLATSSDGVAGPVGGATLEIIERPRVSGELVVALRWDADADLDLHVVDANGVEIWARNPNSWQATPGAPVDPNAWKTGGLLDADSNSQCTIDGRNAENVVWQSAPPSGHYRVRVDTFSLCGQTSARWWVEATLRGQRVAAAEGMSTADASRQPHDLGAGILALEFDVP